MSLYAWGKNTHGQLGVKQDPRPSPGARDAKYRTQQQQQQPTHGAKLPRLGTKEGQGHKPVCVEVDGECFVAAAAGEHHTLVVTQYGDVESFGRGREGQLGHGEGSRLDTDVPSKVERLSDVTTVAVACGAFHSLAISSSGRLYEWGLIYTDSQSTEDFTVAELLALAGPSQGQSNPTLYRDGVVADSARRWLAATDESDTEGESSSNSGSEGDKVDEETALMKRRMISRLPTRSRQALPRQAKSLLKHRVTSISAGYAHSIAVTDEGRAFSSGQNDRGQLGLAHRIHSGMFREVVGMDGRFILEVACGEQHNLARVIPSGKPLSGDAPAELYVWGGGRLGQLGLGPTSTRLAPTHNPFLRDAEGGVVSVSAGANHSVCAVVSGKVYGWGHAEYNQQGVAVVAGADLVTERDGHGYFRVPRVVRGLADAHVVSVHCGSNFTLAVDRAGVTHSFGWNEGDVLGRGWQGAYDPSPGPVPSLPGVVSIAAGSRHAAAVTAEGPAVGRHLRPLVCDAESADVELLAPDAALRGEPGVPVHMSVISARCPYLAGHVEAALRNDSSSGGGNDTAYGKGSELPQTVLLCLQHATAESTKLVAQYLYTDEVALDTSGEALVTLVELAQELLLPRLEGLCVRRLPYSARRRYILQNAGSAHAVPGSISIPPSTFVADLGGLAGSPHYSDVLLVLPSWKWEFHAHKAILCSSPWWSALLKGGFREGDGGTVDLSGLLLHDGVTVPDALEATIRHVYTNSASTVVDMDPSIVMEVVVFAEFMVLPSLINACQCELGRYVDDNSALSLGRFANRYRLFKLESRCREITGKLD